MPRVSWSVPLAMARFRRLERSVPRAEGMTFDAQGNLYLVSEPNLFYAFEHQ